MPGNGAADTASTSNGAAGAPIPFRDWPDGTPSWLTCGSSTKQRPPTVVKYCWKNTYATSSPVRTVIRDAPTGKTRPSSPGRSPTSRGPSRMTTRNASSPGSPARRNSSSNSTPTTWFRPAAKGKWDAKGTSGYGGASTPCRRSTTPTYTSGPTTGGGSARKMSGETSRRPAKKRPNTSAAMRKSHGSWANRSSSRSSATRATASPSSPARLRRPATPTTAISSSRSYAVQRPATSWQDAISGAGAARHAPYTSAGKPATITAATRHRKSRGLIRSSTTTILPCGRSRRQIARWASMHKRLRRHPATEPRRPCSGSCGKHPPGTGCCSGSRTSPFTAATGPTGPAVAT